MIRRTVLLSLLLLGGCSPSGTVPLTSTMEDNVRGLCADVSACIDELSAGRCEADLRDGIRVSSPECESALADFASCVAGLECAVIADDSYVGCEAEASAFDALCVDTPASCDRPCGGCPGSQACVFELREGVAAFFCAVKDPATGSEGDPCSPEGVGCDFGSVCTEGSRVPGCTDEYCCASYCCVGEGACGTGASCAPIDASGVGSCSGP